MGHNLVSNRITKRLFENSQGKQLRKSKTNQRLRTLLAMKAGRRPMGRASFQARVRRVAQTPKAKLVAKNHLLSLHSTCEQVVRKRGAASGR